MCGQGWPGAGVLGVVDFCDGAGVVDVLAASSLEPLAAALCGLEPPPLAVPVAAPPLVDAPAIPAATPPVASAPATIVAPSIFEICIGRTS
jgi:hypothetical protein